MQRGSSRITVVAHGQGPFKKLLRDSVFRASERSKLNYLSVRKIVHPYPDGRFQISIGCRVEGSGLSV